MDDAFRANTLTLAIETEVKDVFIWMFSAFLAGGYSCDDPRWCVIIDLRWAVVIFSYWLSLVDLVFRPLFLGHSCSHALESFILVHFCRFSVWLDWCLFWRNDEFLQLADALWVERGPFIANLANDALSFLIITFAVFFFLSSKDNLSAAQSRQRSWLHASMRISYGIFWHLMQRCGSLESIS